MRRPVLLLALSLAGASGFLLPAPAHAGLYYSGETLAELPSRWRGFLVDHRALRTVALKRAGPATPLRALYEKEAARLAKRARSRRLTADESADLGALYVRLGEPAKALEVLRPAQRDNPLHFRLAANLGTAWQAHGDLAHAAACLEQAVRLAPGKLQKAEELHLKLVRLRAREAPAAQGLDDLFGVRYVGPGGKYEPGRLAPEQRKRLPANAAALAQQLALWLPADARLLWQLGELANAHGDVSSSSAILDACVTEFGLRSPQLQAHRRVVRAAAEARAKAGPDTKAAHEAHALTFRPRSSRPLVRAPGKERLPAVNPRGVNPLPWEVLAKTTIDKHYRPTFAPYLKELAGKRVALEGYMQPLSEDSDLSSFLLIEYPVGCWWCEMPEVVSMVLVEMPAGKEARFSRERVRVTGKLTLNRTDPENFLYTVQDATVREAE
jgi:hypothetical protein